jgi:hypothetical protein
MNAHLPIHLPIEEAEEYAKSFAQIPAEVRQFRESNLTAPVNQFADYVVGQCPVRKSPSLWLIDSNGRIWTSPEWRRGGHVCTHWEGRGSTRIEWPRVPDNGPDFTPIHNLLVRYGHIWGQPGYTLTLANIDHFQVGLWDGILSDDLETVRNLMIWSFDQEFGRGLFLTACDAAVYKHKRIIRRYRRRARLKGEREAA